MSEIAALLVDHLLPAVPYRHITMTFAGPLAVCMGYKKPLFARVLELAGRRIDARLRRNVKHEHRRASVRHLHSGTFTVVQRFKFDLGLLLTIDGTYECNHNPECISPPTFLAAPNWASADLEAIVHCIDRDIAKLLEDDFDHPDHDALAVCARLGRNLVPAQPSGGRPPSSGIVFNGQYSVVCRVIPRVVWTVSLRWPHPSSVRA